MTLVLVASGAFGWPLLLALASLPVLPRIFAVFRLPKPTEPPAGYPEEAWPLWFSAYAFRHTRRFTSLFLLGVIVDTVLS